MAAAKLPIAAAILVAACLASSGCVVMNAGPAPGPTLALREPDTNREYLLYVPSHYAAEREWPLVIACHAARPFDWPGQQIKEWRALAESRGFLVAAPELTSAAGDSSRDPAGQIGRQRQDEEAIRAIVSHIRAARNVDVNAIFISGWQGGAYPALFTALRNPDLFRGAAVRQPRFDVRYVEPCRPYLDHQQPIQVIYGPTDLARRQAVDCVQWLRRARMSVSEQETTSAPNRDPSPMYAFMKNTVRTRAWIRVTAAEIDPKRPLLVGFSLQSSVPVDALLWEFGDGETSDAASPEHAYVAPGTYNVRVTVTSGRKTHSRRIEIRVPRTRIGATQPSTP